MAIHPPLPDAAPPDWLPYGWTEEQFMYWLYIREPVLEVARRGDLVVNGYRLTLTPHEQVGHADV